MRLPDARGSACRGSGEDETDEPVSPRCVTDSDVRKGGATAGSRNLLSTQIVRKPGESNFISLSSHRTLRAMTSLTLAKSRKVCVSTQQRSLSENRRDLRLRIHRFLQTCMNTEDSCYSPVEIWCITAGKGVPMQREWCALRRTLRTPFLRRLLR